MSSASSLSVVSSEARELSLVSKVEMRIALADSDEKLQKLLQTYLAPLLLKLASESPAVRSKVTSVCRHLELRTNVPSFQLPVPALVKQFKDQKSQLIREFDLSYIRQGVNRMSLEARAEVLVSLLQGVSEIQWTQSYGAALFNLILSLLPLLRLPQSSSQEDLDFKVKLGLSSDDTRVLSVWFAKLLLLSSAPKDWHTCPGVSIEEYTLLNNGKSMKETWNPSATGGLNLIETKVAALRFLASGAFSDSDRFIPALIATADPNSRISDLGNEILKRFTPDLEDETIVLNLYDLYFSLQGDGAVGVALKIKILNWLSKSIRATKETEKLILLIDKVVWLRPSQRPSYGLQESKLTHQIFSFTNWVARMASPDDLGTIALRICRRLKDFVIFQGWPTAMARTKLPTTDLTLRGLVYESIGILLPKIKYNEATREADGPKVEGIIWLLQSLKCDDSGSQIFVSIEHALGSVLNSVSNRLDERSQAHLCNFLIDQMTVQVGEEDSETGYTVIRNPQYAAVRFANKFLRFDMVYARLIDLIAVAPAKGKGEEIMEEGKKGLHPYWYRLLNSNNDEKPDTASVEQLTKPWYEFPTFADITFLLDQPPLGASFKGDYPSVFQRYKTSFAPTIAFVRNILLWEAFTTSEIHVEIDEHWEHKLDSLLLTNDQARSAVKRYMRGPPKLPSKEYSMRHSHKSPLLLFFEGALHGLTTASIQGVQRIGGCFIEIASLAPNDVIREFVSKATQLKVSIYCNNQDIQDVAARAYGIVASHPSMPEDSLTSSVAEFIEQATCQVAVGEAALRARGALLALAFLFSRLALRKLVYRIASVQLGGFIEEIKNILTKSPDSFLRRAAETALFQFSLAGMLSPETFSKEDWGKIREKLMQDAKAETEVAITAMGSLCLIFSNSGRNSAISNDILSKLYELHEIRSPEIHFAVGEALSIAAGGWRSAFMDREFDVDEARPEFDIPPTILGDVCDRVMAGCFASKPALRKASAVWLLSLVKNCAHLEEMQQRLRNCQESFTYVLEDRDELVQETGAQGLNLIYEMGGRKLKDDLVQDLVNSFTASRSNLGGGRVNHDTELFEPGALPTGERSSVSTYKDVMDLASEVGDPSLVYRLMSLASNNAIWTNRAAFSRLGISNIFADSSVNGYLAKNPKIYPKLYRYRFDPNPNVQRSMNTIWQALIKNPSAIIDENFNDFMDDLLQSMLAGREWRVRQASCMAVVDLITSRPPGKFSQYIEEILMRAFRLLDDIKGTVRVAALQLCQTATNAMIRALESADTISKQANAMIGKVIHFLLSDKGMESSVEEVRAFAVGALIDMTKKSPGSLLSQYIPDVIEKFLSSLSALEPQAVNYVHLNAAKYGLTGQEIDKVRLSTVQNSPMMEAIERHLVDNLDESNMTQLAAKLEDVLRSAVGLPSKVGCSRVLVMLSMKKVLFQPYADRFILLLSNRVLDRNETVSASYSTAIGYLMRLASDGAALNIIENAKSLYLNAEDASNRIVSSELFRSISKLSNDRFKAFSSTALPFAFICKHDEEEHVKTGFESAWQDNIGGSRAVSLYIREIVQMSMDYLNSARWVVKHTAALAIADAIFSLDKRLDNSTSELLWPALEKALAGKTWEGKEIVLKAFVRYNRQAYKLWHEQKPLADAVKAITIREARRNNAMYRPHSLSAMGEISRIRDDMDFMSEALDIVPGVVDEIVDSNGQNMDIDSGSVQTSETDILKACLKCFGQCLNASERTSAAALKRYVLEMTLTCEKALNYGGRNLQTTFFVEVQGLFVRLGEWALHTRTTASSQTSEISAALEVLAGKLLFREADTSVEAIRKERAEAALSYVKLRQEALELPLCDEHQQLIKAWSETERSAPVREILGHALKELASRT